MQIRAITFYISVRLRYINKKTKMKGILVVLVKYRHSENGLFPVMAGSISVQDKLDTVFRLATQAGNMGLYCPITISYLHPSTKTFSWPYKNLLLTKFVCLGPLDIGLVSILFLLHCYWLQLCLSPSKINAKKGTWPTSTISDIKFKWFSRPCTYIFSLHLNIKHFSLIAAL